MTTLSIIGRRRSIGIRNLAAHNGIPSRLDIDHQVVCAEFGQFDRLLGNACLAYLPVGITNLRDWDLWLFMRVT